MADLLAEKSIKIEDSDIKMALEVNIYFFIFYLNLS
jgi:hypothetical protein